MTAAHARQSRSRIATRPRKIVFNMETTSFPGIGLHPHSGIATVTYLFEGSVRYEDTSGATGVLRAGGVEWFRAGGNSEASRSRLGSI